MKLFMGGYGTTSLNNIPFIDYIYDNKIDMKIVANGFACYYAILRENFNKKESVILIKEFIQEYLETFMVMELAFCKENLISRKKALLLEKKYNKIWSKKISIFYSPPKKFFNSIIKNKRVISEVFNICDKKFELLDGPLEVAISSISYHGLFEPFKGKYITSTHFYGSPLNFIEDGDKLIKIDSNLEDYSSENIAEIMVKALRMRANKAEEFILIDKKIKIKRIKNNVKWIDEKGTGLAKSFNNNHKTI